MGLYTFIREIIRDVYELRRGNIRIAPYGARGRHYWPAYDMHKQGLKPAVKLKISSQMLNSIVKDHLPPDTFLDVGMRLRPTVKIRVLRADGRVEEVSAQVEVVDGDANS